MSHSKENIPEKTYDCKICLDRFNELKLLKLHEQNLHGMRIYHCKHCDRYYTEGTNYYRHVRNAHRGYIRDNSITDLLRKRRKVGGVISNDTSSSSGPTDNKYICNLCNKSFTRIDNLKRHMTHQVCKNTRKLQRLKPNENAVPVVEKNLNTTKKRVLSIQDNQNTRSESEISMGDTSEFTPDKPKLLETAFQSRLATYKMKNQNEMQDPLQYLQLNRETVSKLIRKEIRLNQTIKVNMMIECTHINILGEHQIRTFKTKNEPLFQESDIEKFLTRCFDKMNMEMTEHAAKKSGWTVYSVNHLEIRINKYTPLAGHRFMRLPNEIAARKAVINVENEDNECFKYAILSKYFLGTNLERVSKYGNMKHQFDFSSITFPTALSDIPIFERRNKLSINVFGWDNESRK